MKREFDPTQLTFFKTPRLQNSFLSRVRPYHPGVFHQEDAADLPILVLGSAEVKYLKEKVGTIPISDITDPDTQVWIAGSLKQPTENQSEKPVGFVQDTEGARKALEEGKFQEEAPALSLVPDINFDY